MTGVLAFGAAALVAVSKVGAEAGAVLAAGAFVATGAVLRIDFGGNATGGAVSAAGAGAFGGSTEPACSFLSASRTPLPVFRAWPPMM